MIVTLGDLVVRTTPTPVPDVPVALKLVDLRNWYSSAPIRSEITDMPSTDGAFEPERSYRGAKVMALRGWVLGRTAEEAVALGYDYIAGIAPVGEALTLKVEDVVGDRYMTVRPQAADVEPYTDRRARFQIPLIATDSRKYGPLGDPNQWPAAAPSGGSGDGLMWPLFGEPTTGTLDFGSFSPTGLITLENKGSAPSWPIFHVYGAIDSAGFQIVSGEDVIEFSAAVASGNELVLNPYAGGRALLDGVDVTGGSLTRSEWAPVMPRSTRVYSFDPLGVADATARLTVEFREAWW